MRFRPRAIWIFALIGFGLTAAPAQAYIDPGAGSLALQALIGGLAALLFALRSQWARLASRFGLASRASSAAKPIEPSSAPPTER